MLAVGFIKSDIETSFVAFLYETRDDERGELFWDV